MLCWVIAAAIGCSELFSMLAASFMSSSWLPLIACVSVTAGLPSVIVPVLSSAIACTSFIVCIASPFLMRTPLVAPRPLATINAVGVASPKAHGQLITNTAMVARIAKLMSGSSGLVHGRLNVSRIARWNSGNIIQLVNAAIAMRRTAGTK